MNVLRLLPVALALSLLACKPQAPTSDTQAPAPAPTGTGPASSTEPAAPVQAQLPVPPPQHWQCGELRVTTRFQGAGQDTLELLMSGRRVPLRAAPATEGTRFADASGNEFAQRPGSATLTVPGRGATTCIQASAVSPWVDASLRGMAWRLAGSEPGWFAEISDSDTPTIKASVDNGSRSYNVARAERVPADEITWSGAADNGAVVSVVVERSSCTDPMSGEDFEATGTLTVSGQTYRGCAASLKD